MQNIDISPPEIRKIGWEVLRSQLGISRSLKFILEYSKGEGDYTQTRKLYFQDLTVKSILEDMRSKGFIR